MLEYLRNAADKTWAKILMGILIFSFVGWGAANWIFGNTSRDTTIVRVGNSSISVQQFNAEKSQQLSYMTKDQQRAIYTDPIKASELNQSVLSTLTMNQLAQNRAVDMGFVVSDKRIAQEIRSYPEFQYDGKFSPAMLSLVLQNSGLSEEGLASSLRSKILRSMALSVVSVPIAVPEFVVKSVYKAKYAEREIEYIAVNFNAFKVSKPTDKQLEEFYLQHPQIIPETRVVSYVFIPTEMEKPDAYDVGYRTATKIEDMIIAGEPMKTAASKYGAKYETVASVSKGTKIKDNVLNEELITKIFSMDIGIESELLELKKGFLILRVDEIVAAHNANFKDVKDSLIVDWKKSQQRKEAYIAANDYLIKLNNKESVKGLKKVNVVSRIKGAPIVVLNAAFKTSLGDNVLVEDQDVFYVVHINQEIEPKIDKKKMLDVRKELEKISARYLSDDYSEFLKRYYPIKMNNKTFNKFIK